MITVKNFNTLPIPTSVIESAATRAAVECLQTFDSAERALRLKRVQPQASAVHARVLSARELSARLNRAVQR